MIREVVNIEEQGKIKGNKKEFTVKGTIVVICLTRFCSEIIPHDKKQIFPHNWSGSP